MKTKHSLGFEANVHKVERKRGEDAKKLHPPPLKHAFVNSHLDSANVASASELGPCLLTLV
jgi:hypothetical protein